MENRAEQSENTQADFDSALGNAKDAPTTKNVDRREIAARMQKELGLPKSNCDEILSDFLDLASHGLAQAGELKLAGFGSLRVLDKAARMGRNPKTGEAHEIPARQTVGFRPSRHLKDAANALSSEPVQGGAKKGYSC